MSSGRKELEIEKTSTSVTETKVAKEEKSPISLINLGMWYSPAWHYRHHLQASSVVMPSNGFNRSHYKF